MGSRLLKGSHGIYRSSYCPTKWGYDLGLTTVLLLAHGDYTHTGVWCPWAMLGARPAMTPSGSEAETILTRVFRSTYMCQIRRSKFDSTCGTYRTIPYVRRTQCSNLLASRRRYCLVGPARSCRYRRHLRSMYGPLGSLMVCGWLILGFVHDQCFGDVHQL